VLILAESHITVSTWPEHQLAHIDVFTCRADSEPGRAIQPILDLLTGQITHTQNVPRTPPGSLLPPEALDKHARGREGEIRPALAFSAPGRVSERIRSE